MSPKGTKEMILRNVFSNWGYYVISTVVGFFMMPFMVHRLGSTIYGFWVLILSLTGYMGLFDLGMKGTAVKFISEFKAKKNFENINKIATTVYTVQNLIGIVVFLLSVLMAVYFENFIKVDIKYILDIKLTIILLGINIALSFFGGVFGGVLEACKRTDFVSIIEVIALILQTILIITGIIMGRGIVVLGLILLFVNALRQLARLFYSFKVLPQLKIAKNFFDVATVKRVFGYGVYIFILSLSSKLVFRTDNIVIGIFLGASAITSYNVALRLIGYYMTINFFSAGVLVPFVSEYHATLDKTKLRKLFFMGTKYLCLITGLIAPIFIFGGKRLIELWMGYEFVSNYTILVILLIPYLFAPSYFLVAPILKGIGNLRIYTSLVIIEGVTNLLLSIFLARKIGLAGVALGTTIPFLIIHAGIMTAYMLRMLKISIKDYVQTSLTPVFVPAAVLSLSLIGLIYYTHTSSLLLYLFELGVCTIVYVFICFRMSLDNGEKAFYLKWLQLPLGLFSMHKIARQNASSEDI